MADSFDIAAFHIHDAHCAGDPCYDATTEQHRFGPKTGDYRRAEMLLAALDAGQAAKPARAGYEAAIATLLDVAQRTGSPAAQWAAEYLAVDPDKRAPSITGSYEAGGS